MGVGEGDPADEMSATDGAGRARSLAEWRKGWRTVLAAALGSATGLILFSYIVSFFVKPQTIELGWTRGEASWSSVSTVIAGLLAPLVGRLSDVWGVKPVILLGGLGYGAASVGLSLQTGELWVYYLLMFVFVFTGLGTSSITWARTVSAAFSRSRGLALSVALSSVTLTAALMPLAITAVMDRFGWRGAWLLVGGVGFFASLIAVAMLPSGAGAAAAKRAPGQPGATGVGVGQAVRQPAFWCLVLGMGIINIPSGGIMSSMAALLSDKGVPGPEISSIASSFALSVFIGRVIAGVCLDRFSPPVVAALAMGVPSIGCVLLAGGPAIIGVMLAGIVLAGLSQGAESDVGPFLVSRYFGLGSFGAIMGGVNAAVVGGTGVGGIVFGQLFDRYGSYTPALWVGAGCFLFGATLFLGVGLSPARREHPPEGSAAVNQLGF